MRKCGWTQEIEAHFDGFAASPERVEAHLASCPACQAHHAVLARTRRGIQALAQPPQIGDGQFQSFMRGVREGIAEPAPRHARGLWAALSMAAAALLVAAAAFYVINDGPDLVNATEVEWADSDLEGATVNWYDTEDGGATVWITVSKEDVW